MQLARLLYTEEEDSGNAAKYNFPVARYSIIFCKHVWYKEIRGYICGKNRAISWWT